jgi:hypothetical protein
MITITETLKQRCGTCRISSDTLAAAEHAAEAEARTVCAPRATPLEQHVSLGGIACEAKAAPQAHSGGIARLAIASVASTPEHIHRIHQLGCGALEPTVSAVDNLHTVEITVAIEYCRQRARRSHGVAIDLEKNVTSAQARLRSRARRVHMRHQEPFAVDFRRETERNRLRCAGRNPSDQDRRGADRTCQTTVRHQPPPIRFLAFACI